MKPSKIKSKPKKITEAVLLINDKHSQFSNVSFNLPCCFLPLANAPIIHYVIIKLIDADFTNFHIFPGKCKENIKKYFQLMNYSDYSLEKIEFKVYDEIGDMSTGDIFRKLDYEKFQNGFLFINSDTITNIDFRQIIERHNKLDTNNVIVMSQIMTKVLPSSIKSYAKKAPVYLIDKEKEVLVNIFQIDEEISVNKSSEKYITESELYDPEIYVCSGQIISRFQENFDCHSFDQLIDQLTTYSDIIQESIRIISTDEINIRILNPNIYFEISKLILRGTFSSLTPTKIFGDNIKIFSDKIATKDNFSYISSHLSEDFIDYKTKLLGNNFVNIGCYIGDNCRLTDVVVGQSCKIGNSVILRNCIIMNNVTIGDNVIIGDSIICSNVNIGSDSKILQKSLVDFNYSIPNKSTITASMKSINDVENIWDKGYVIEKKVSLNVSDKLDDENSDLDDNIAIKDEIHELIKESINRKSDSELLKHNMMRVKSLYDIEIDELCVLLTEVFVAYPLKEPINDKKYGVYFKELIESCGEVLHVVTKTNFDRETHCYAMLETAKDKVFELKLPMEKLADIFFCLYDDDIVNRNDILTWYKDIENNGELDEKSHIAEGLAKFLDFLKENSDSSEEDSESD